MSQAFLAVEFFIHRQEIAPEVQEAMVDQGLGEDELVDMANVGILSNVTKWAENQNQRAVEDFERRHDCLVHCFFVFFLFFVFCFFFFRFVCY
jgi:hypothetical protein